MPGGGEGGGGGYPRTATEEEHAWGGVLEGTGTRERNNTHYTDTCVVVEFETLKLKTVGCSDWANPDVYIMPGGLGTTL